MNQVMSPEQKKTTIPPKGRKRSDDDDEGESQQSRHSHDSDYVDKIQQGEDSDDQDGWQSC